MTAYNLIRRVIHQPILDVRNGCRQSSLKNGSPASVCIAITAGADKDPVMFLAAGCAVQHVGKEPSVRKRGKWA